MFNNGSIMEATTAVRTAAIPDCGRRVYYCGYLIHGEIPGICYAIYGRNEFGQVAELGAARDFTEAMRWVDRHRDQMSQPMPVDVVGTTRATVDQLATAV